MPGDCSPSRSVVSKIRTRACSVPSGVGDASLSLMSFPGSFLNLDYLLLRWYAATRPPRAIPPEGGGAGEAGTRAETTSTRRLAPAARIRERELPSRHYVVR